MKYKSESEIFEELYESIYSGNITDDDSDEKDESTEDEKDDGVEEKEEKYTKDESEESEEESEESEDDSDDDSENDSEDGDESEKGDDIGTPKAGGAFKTQVKSLKKQYNDLLIDSFEKYSTDCISDALDEVDSAFGENISDILDLAMSKLKEKIMGDLGVEVTSEMDEMPPAAMGGFDPSAGADTPMEISIERG